MKTCSQCREEKPLVEFYFQTRGNRYKSACKSCEGYGKIKYLYGLDRETYDKMAVLGCAICGSHRFLQVDHDHSCCPGRKSCGKCVRALLCKRHNVVIGLLRESQDEMDAITKYLEKENFTRDCHRV